MCGPEGPLLVPSQPNEHPPPLRGLVLFHTIYHCVRVRVRVCSVTSVTSDSLQSYGL